MLFFFVELEYENLPDYFSTWNIIGHNLGNCKRKGEEVGMDGDKGHQKRQRKKFI